MFLFIRESFLRQGCEENLVDPSYAHTKFRNDYSRRICSLKRLHNKNYILDFFDADHSKNFIDFPFLINPIFFHSAARKFPPLAEVIKLGQMESAAAAAHLKPQVDQNKKTVPNGTSSKSTPSQKPALTTIPSQSVTPTPSTSRAPTPSPSIIKKPDTVITMEPSPEPKMKSTKSEQNTNESKTVKTTPTATPSQEIKPQQSSNQTKTAPEKASGNEEAKKDVKKSAEVTCKATTVSEVPRPSTSKSAAAKKNLPWL